MGGEAGAAGGRGLDMSCGIEDAFGVKGGRGCENWSDSFLRDRLPAAMMLEGALERGTMSLSEPREGNLL